MSDLRSAITAAAGDVTLGASSISDIRSAIAAGPAATVTASDISDIASAVWANAIGARVDSRVLLTQSPVSDIQSALAAGVPAVAETLDQAWETALAADRRMRAAGHLTQSAEEALAAARGARLPRLSVDGGYTFWITRRPSW